MQIDEFASQFKRAIHDVYQYQPAELQSVVLICDCERSNTGDLEAALARLVPQWNKLTNFEILGSDDYDSVCQVMDKLSQMQVDLIVAERNLKTKDRDLVYGLSNYVDALTQARPEPVLLLPTLSLENLNELIETKTDILVDTNQLTGANTLINWALSFATVDTTLHLTHIEDDTVFERYMSVIERITQIDSDSARTQITEMLLAIPTQFADHVKHKLSSIQPTLPVFSEIRLGHSLADYETLIKSHPVRMLVVNTEVQGQLAMSGMAYVTAVEFKETPMLLL